MLYSLIRLILTMAVAAIVFMILKRKKFQLTSKRFLFIFLGIIGIYYTFMFIRFENIFITFPSAEAVWRYELGNVGELHMVIEGNDSSLIIYTRDKERSFAVYPKSKDGWKLNSTLFEKAQSKTIGDPIKCVVFFFKTQNSNECFIFVDALSTLGISDNIGSNFKKIDIYEDPYQTTYYAVAPLTQQQYELSVGDETTVLDLR